MTYADEEFLPEGQVESPNYPTAFGVTITPKVGGVICAVLGLLGATYLLVNAVQPAWQQYQELKTTVENKESEIARQAQLQKQIEQKKVQLAQAQQKNKQVLSLFADEKTLDTLLLDVNSFVKSGNGTLSLYEPGGQNAQQTDTVITDGSLGPEVNGKLKRKTINVQLKGSFVQIQSILRRLEQLQTLLLLKDFQLTLDDELVVLVNPESGKSITAVRKKDSPADNKVIPGAQPTLGATFKLEALMPISQAQQPNTGATPAPAQPTAP